MPKTILITGASSGMGKAATTLFAQNGWQVFAGARRVELIPEGANIHPLYLDVCDHASNSAFVAKALTQQTRLDVLLNNAGYGEYGPLEEVPLASARKQLETNLLGAADLTQLVLPLMRRQGFGRIINNSSIGGDMYSPLGGWYYVSKHALNVWSDTLDAEIRQFHLRSVVVEPAGTASNWSAIAMQNARRNLHPDSPYAALTDGFVDLFERFLQAGSATSEDLAQVFFRAATDRRPHRRYYNKPQDHAVAAFARRYPNAFAGVINAAARLAIRTAH